MQVITLLPPKLLAHVVEVLAGAHSVHSATNPIELHRIICSQDAGLLILDPALHDGEFAGAIEATVAQFQSLPVLVYTTVSARAMGLTLRLAHVGVRHLVLHEIDDDPRRFLEVIERVPAYPVIDVMLHELDGPLSLLPPRVTRAMELLFQSPSRARTSIDFAQLAGMTRRTLYRHMAPAGLQPRKVIDCAPPASVHAPARSGQPIEGNQYKLGLAGPQTLRDLIREWTGQTTRRIQHGIPAAKFAHLRATYLLRSEDIARYLSAECDAVYVLAGLFECCIKLCKLDIEDIDCHQGAGTQTGARELFSDARWSGVRCGQIVWISIRRRW